MNISVIIPIYNDDDVIPATLDNLRKKLKGAYEIIVVDDCSSDNTVAVINKIAADFKNVRLITNKYKKSFANALRTGFEAARYDVIIPVMADLCDEIEAIPLMCAKLSEGFDIVSASRYIRGGARHGGPVVKAILSYLSGWIMHAVRRFPTTDCTNSFKAYRKNVLESINIESTGFEVSMEIVVKAHLRGFRIAEIPTRWTERTAGKTHFAVVGNGIKYIKWLIRGLFGKRDVC